MNDMTSVTLLKVSDNQAKLQRICETIRQHFESGNAVIVFVPNQDAAKYVDELLWRMPEESFIPHAISNTSSKDPIVITTEPKNLNQAKIMLNLCPGISPLSGDFQSVYDLIDETHPSKVELSAQRLAAYKSNGFSVYLDS